MPQEAKKDNIEETRERIRDTVRKSYERLKSQNSNQQPVSIPQQQKRMMPGQIKAVHPEIPATGIHRTKSGAPDRRFVENQHLTSRQAEIEKARYLLQTLGQTEVEEEQE